MSRGVQWPIVGLFLLVALIGLAGCSHYWLAEREPWRHDAEVACLNSGAVKETPERVRISAINGPGICGADFPLRVSALGDSAPLGYDDEPLRPPGNIPTGAMPPRWPVVQPAAMPRRQSAPPLPTADAACRLPPPSRWLRHEAAEPLVAHARQGLPEPEQDDEDFMPGPPRPYDGAPRSLARAIARRRLTRRVAVVTGAALVRKSRCRSARRARRW